LGKMIEDNPVTQQGRVARLFSRLKKLMMKPGEKRKGQPQEHHATRPVRQSPERSCALDGTNDAKHRGERKKIRSK